MKRKILLCLSLIGLFIIPNKVFAGSLSVSVSCKDTLVNQTTTCTVTGSPSGASISGFSASYQISGGTFVSFTPGSGWSGEGSGGTIDLYTDNNKSGSFTIGTFTIRAGGEGKGSLTLTGVGASDENFNTISSGNAAGSFNVKVDQPKTTTTTTKRITTMPHTTEVQETTTTAAVVPLELTSLVVEGFTVTFENGIYYATVESSTEEVNISATAGEGISILGVGPRSLAKGKNSVELILRNENNETATVSLIITRPDGNGDYDTLLSNLMVVGYKLDFNKNTYSYDVTVPFDTKDIYVLAESNNKDAFITGAGVYHMKKGSNKIYVTVSYGDLQSTEYVINIKKNYLTLIMWIIIGLMGGGLIGLSIYYKLDKKRAVEAVVNANNKEIAEEKRRLEAERPETMLNGQVVKGIINRTVEPSPVAPIINNQQEPIKVVNSVNSNVERVIDLDKPEPAIMTPNGPGLTTNNSVNMTNNEPQTVVVHTAQPVKTIQTVGNVQTVNTNNVNNNNM